MAAMEEGADWADRRYWHKDGTPCTVFDLDDTYESLSMKPILYAMGGDDRLLQMALRQWNGVTRYYDDGTSRRDDPVHPQYWAQVHNEYYNQATPNDAFHQGEGNQDFYEFGLADPTIVENVRRARRFAEMFTGEDPDAPNYDPRHKIIRSPFTSSQGPIFHAEQKQGEGTAVEFVRQCLERWTCLDPVIENLEPGWFDAAERRDEILGLFDQMVLNGDIPLNLATTSLVTTAYLYTGEDKYRRWVLEYVEAWIDRMRRNNGILPDNVGPTGTIGEQRQGQWWGGPWGWNMRDRWMPDLHLLLSPLAVAAENAVLLSGDLDYLELPRSQIQLLMEKAVERDGELHVPRRHGPNGWEDWKPMSIREFQTLTHLYHASMAPEDYELIARVREASTSRDWNHTGGQQGRGGEESEYARFQYYDGKNPGWPLMVLEAEYRSVLAYLESMRRDSRSREEIIRDNRWPPNPVFKNALTMVALGMPANIYRGGLVRGQVRYFDQDRGRPGLPPDVGALVDELGADRAGIQLVNTSLKDTHKIIVQAGVFGEHQFTEVSFQEETREGPEDTPHTWIRDENLTRIDRVLPADGKHIVVELPPSTAVRIDAGMQRFVNAPSYAFPWH